jgi:hypothetical protein
MTFKKQKFAYQHPLFGRGKKPKESYDSVYFYWWEFLRRSDEYKKCCKSGGKGRLGKLYEDFGDIFNVDFKTWWKEEDRGARLFAEQLTPEFKVVTSIDNEHTHPDVMHLQVPMSLPKRALARKFQEFMNQHHSGRAGKRNNASSTARYPVVGHVDWNALDNCLRVYDMKMNNKDMKHWQVAEKCIAGTGKMSIKDDDYGKKGEVSAKRNILANISNRYIKRANKLIDNVINGKFPGES